jgi:beta-phosphoglucomutase
MPEIKAFIFDLDGVITDTAEYHYRAWKRLADENGLPFTREDNDQLRGVDRRESLRRLLKGRPVPPEKFEEWLTLKNDYYRAFLKEITPADLLPGVAVFLTEAQERGIKLAIGSASKNAREVLRNLGIAALMDVIGDGATVVRQKPAPDLFVWAAGRMDAHPAATVVFEDAEAGIDAAREAGMHTVGLGPAERVGRADIVLPSLDGIHVKEILDRLSAKVDPNGAGGSPT